jgi:hypothetical protein
MNAAPIAISGVFHFAGFIGTSADILGISANGQYLPQAAAAKASYSPTLSTRTPSPANSGATGTKIVFQQILVSFLLT